ncbi:MAG: type I 3-dehydroquinate dehydratase [Vicinamibacterales bacterium]|nr:type I 3-dehydroquinate dehydratase [Vicinamibacterales bacterium]
MNGRPRLCATVTGTTTAELRARRDAVRDADLLELRLDTVADPDVAGALQGRRSPVILTCRSAREGGQFQGSEAERRRILLAAARSDAEYVDVEWQARFDDVTAARGGRGIVLSVHDFAGVPDDLAGRVAAMAREGAEIVKVAVTVSRLSDCTELLRVSRTLDRGRSVLIGMGPAGLVTRVLAARFGSAWSYAGDGIAPGQVSLAAMEGEFGFRRIQAGTALYGLAGRPVEHSLSPAMHNAAFRELGVDAVYVPLPAADIDDLRAFAETFRVAGVSVTAPFKTGVVPMASAVTRAARDAGAANTLVRVGEGFSADNTDIEGFLAPLAGFGLEGARVAVLGHGGAARAVAVALGRFHAQVTLYGRDGARAAAAAGPLGVTSAPRPVPPGSWDVLVNATPAGTFPACDETAFPEATFDGGLVYDLVYNPVATALLRAAGAAGCRTIGGLDMLLHQAALQQERWTGRRPSLDGMRGAALWKLSMFAGGV